MADLKSLLVLRECVGGKPALKVYNDSRGFLTVGIGHKVLARDKLKLNDTIDDTRVDAFFKIDSAAAVVAARAQVSEAKINDSDFQVYLASVNFQLGTAWNTIHIKTWSLIVHGKYADAAEEVGKSHWASQTPVRVADFQGALLDLAKKSGSKPRGAPETGMERGTMKLLLNKSKKRQIMCAVGVSADARHGLLLMHLTRKPKALAAELVKSIPGARGLRWGTVSVDVDTDPKLAKFALNRAVSQLERKIKKTLRGTGISKVQIVAAAV